MSSYFEENMVVINGVRYRREEARALGLKSPEEVVAELAAAEVATIKAAEDPGVDAVETAKALSVEQTLKRSAAVHIEATRVAAAEAAAAPLSEEDPPGVGMTPATDAVADPTEGVALPPVEKATTARNKSRTSEGK